MNTTTMPMPTITVRVPCDCPGRWFQCRCDAPVVAVYRCHRDLDGTGMVHPEDAGAVLAMHPEMELVYLGPPPRPPANEHTEIWPPLPGNTMIIVNHLDT